MPASMKPGMNVCFFHHRPYMACVSRNYLYFTQKSCIMILEVLNFRGE